MSLYVKGGVGITKLSELVIDANKDWQAKGITNLKELAATMAKGDLPVRSNVILQRFVPGGIGLVLTSGGPGHMLAWAPCTGTEFERYIVAWIELHHAEAIVEADKVFDHPCSWPTEHKESYEDAPADYIKQLTPAVALVDDEAIVVPHDTIGKSCGIAAAPYSWKKVVDGASAEDGGAFTDETAKAQDAVADDMTLLPACINGGLVVDDAYYFGFAYKFDRLWLNVGVAGVGNYALAHEYWDGDSWELLPDIVDETSEFTIAGLNKMDFTKPGDWATTNKGGDLPATLYWIRARVTAVVTYTTQPLGTQAWCEVFI